MISIRPFWWAALVATALVGCSNDAEETNSAASPPVTPGVAPATPPVATGGMKADMTAPAPALENMPKTTASETVSKPEPIPIEVPKIEPPAPSKPEEKKADASAGGKEKEAAVVLSAEEVAEIKKLPEAEAVLALKQAVCPVSGEHLGSMDVPIRVKAEGKTFYLCCKGCNKELNADPKAVVAKLKQ